MSHHELTGKRERAPRVLVETDAEIEMRDGTVLRADIYRPDTAHRVPTVIQRHPYDKSSLWMSGLLFDPLHAARSGLAVVVQDVRGRYRSQGVFDPFRQEGLDGYDTIEWVAQYPWSDGRVGLLGGSYGGMCAWLAALERPPHLQAFLSSMSPDDAFAFLYHGGAFALFQGLSWVAPNLAPDNLDRIYAGTGQYKERLLRHRHLVDNLASAFHVLPPQRLTDLVDLAPYYYDWLAHPTRDEYWRAGDIKNRLDLVETPVFNLGGWYDIATDATLRSFRYLRTNGASAKVKSGSCLLMGPWHHWLPLSGHVGEVDFGVGASQAAIDLQKRTVDWFRYWLAGDGLLPSTVVQVFLMGANRWFATDEWPVSGTETSEWYLSSRGGANGASGDGILLVRPPRDIDTDRLVHNPLELVPTRGGGLCCWPAVAPGGAYNQSEVENRDDVLVYTSQPFSQPLAIVGEMSLVLWIESSELPIDVHAKVVDLAPDGFARNIRSANKRISSLAELASNGALTLDLGATANVFLPGHALRIEIAASNFPEIEPIMETRELRVHHGGAMASHLSVTVSPQLAGGKAAYVTGVEQWKAVGS